MVSLFVMCILYSRRKVQNKRIETFGLLIGWNCQVVFGKSLNLIKKVLLEISKVSIVSSINIFLNRIRENRINLNSRISPGIEEVLQDRNPCMWLMCCFAGADYAATSSPPNSQHCLCTYQRTTHRLARAQLADSKQWSRR